MTTYNRINGLTTRVRRRADMENSTFCSDAEIKEYLWEGFGELWDIISETDPSLLLVTLPPQTTTANQTFVWPILANGAAKEIEYQDSLPDIYKLVAVDVKVGTTWGRARPMQYHESPLTKHDDDNFWPVTDTDAGGGGWVVPEQVRYHLQGNHEGAIVDPSDPPTGGIVASSPLRSVSRIQFYPTPRAAHSILITAVLTPAFYFVDSYIFDDGRLLRTFQGFTGWEEYVVLDAAAKCLEKEESNAEHLWVRKERIAERIRHHLTNRMMDDAGEVRDRDVSITSFPWRGEPIG